MEIDTISKFLLICYSIDNKKEVYRSFFEFHSYSNVFRALNPALIYYDNPIAY